MEDRALQHVRVAKAQLGEDARGGAGAEHDRRYQAEPAQQGGGVVGLLADRGRRPARRPGAAGVAPAIVGDDRVGVREDVSDRCPVPRIAAGPGDEQHSGPAAPLLVVDPDAIYLDGAHKPSSSPPPPARVLSPAPTEITPRTPVKVTASVRSNYLPRGSPRAFWVRELAYSPAGPGRAVRLPREVVRLGGSHVGSQ